MASAMGLASGETLKPSVHSATRSPGRIDLLCDACQTHEAEYHVTLQVTLVSSRAQKTKLVQFWLCEACELSSRQILTRDDLLRRRLAFRFVDNPTFMSTTSRWRKKSPSNRARAKLETA